MKPIIKNENNNSLRPISGYNKATLKELKTESFTSKDGRACTVTNAVFQLVGGSDKAFENVSLTDTDDNAKEDVVNMVIKAFGGKEMKVGEDPTAVLNRCIGKECAMLMYKQGEYLHTAKYGFFNGNPALKPVSAVGEEFTYDQKPKKDNKPEPKSDEENPF